LSSPSQSPNDRCVTERGKAGRYKQYSTRRNNFQFAGAAILQFCNSSWWLARPRVQQRSDAVAAGARRDDASPRQRATACSPGRVREPWEGRRPQDASPRQRATEPSISPIDFQTTSGEMLSPLRGLGPCRVAYPGLADSPWATCGRPLRGLAAG